MRILIATPLYPPDVGGPSYYARELEVSFRRMKHDVSVVSFGPLLSLPLGLRHFAYLLRLVPSVLRADAVIALDTFSAAVPAVFLARLFNKKIIVRTGGDFLWEHYLERTGHLIPLRIFYQQRPSLSLKERLIFRLIQYVVSRSVMVFSTTLQQETWSVYGCDSSNSHRIENAFPASIEGFDSAEKRFMWNVRPIAMKNGAAVREAFAQAKERYPAITLDDAIYPKEELLERMKTCRAIILPSVTEISPNLLIDAARMHKPFIIDKYCGLIDLLGPYGTIVDPLDVSDIVRGIATLCDERGYAAALDRVKQFRYERSYDTVAVDFIKLLQ